MLLHDRRKNAPRMLMLGLAALVVANVGGHVVERKLALAASVADVLRGFLHGVAIATLLLGAYLASRARRGAAPRR